jgi:hypothetical protein
MRALRSSVTAVYLAILLAGWAFVWATLPLNGQSGQLPMEPLHESGQNVTAAYEGWFKNPDGSFSMLFGYFNRNVKQELDIPIGDNNRIEPGPPDQGQPTHFLPRRQWGIFTVTVPRISGPRSSPGRSLPTARQLQSLRTWMLGGKSRPSSTWELVIHHPL